MGHMARDCPNKGAKGQKGAGDGGGANGSTLALKVLLLCTSSMLTRCWLVLWVSPWNCGSWIRRLAVSHTQTHADWLHAARCCCFTCSPCSA
jgi:hypothetical protein